MKQTQLFDLPPVEGEEFKHTFKPLQTKIWTENKARLIERYLYYFVQITHHGTYIDGFAGQQDQSNPESWAAKLVLESKPTWLRRFYLCELHVASYNSLVSLINSQPSVSNRTIRHWNADFNEKLPEILQTASIKPTEASFCLLDQRTFECEWNTVKSIAETKQSNKIELFYFFATGWLNRSIKATTNDLSTLNKWWGGEDWGKLLELKSAAQAEILQNRFKREFGYKYVFNWPIFKRSDGGNIMYYMVHASDHKEAPNLMARAYKQAVYPLEPQEQYKLELEEWRKDNNAIDKGGT